MNTKERPKPCRGFGLIAVNLLLVLVISGIVTDKRLHIRFLDIRKVPKLDSTLSCRIMPPCFAFDLSIPDGDAWQFCQEGFSTGQDDV